jgi:hypothetical protein
MNVLTILSYVLTGINIILTYYNYRKFQEKTDLYEHMKLYNDKKLGEDR